MDQPEPEHGGRVVTIIFGGYVLLAPPNPYCVPDQHLVEFGFGEGEGWGGGTLHNIWWVCAAGSSKPLPCS